jgi:hypothetical protein
MELNGVYPGIKINFKFKKKLRKIKNSKKLKKLKKIIKI